MGFYKNHLQNQDANFSDYGSAMIYLPEIGGYGGMSDWEEVRNGGKFSHLNSTETQNHPKRIENFSQTAKMAHVSLQLP